MASYQPAHMNEYDDEDDMFDPDEPQVDDRRKSKGKVRADEDEEDDDEEQEEAGRGQYDDDEDDEEEEEEEEVGPKGAKRRKHRHKRSAVSRFIDLEAEVSDEDEEEEEEDDDAGAFIDTFDDDDAAEDLSRRHHALLDTRRQFEAEDKSPEQIAKEMTERYGGQRHALRYTGDLNDVPQRLLMPSVHDPSLWQVRVKAGRERDIIFSLMRKSIDMEYTAHPLSILSAFQRDSLPGMIYVEARSSKQVQQAVQGLVGVYISRGIHLVPIEEMASLLTIKKQEQTVKEGTWVRIKRGKYAGDLAMVMDVTENGEDVGLRFIPRIDLSPRDENALDVTKKRKKPALLSGSARPPQKLFNFEEVTKVWGRKNVHAKRGNVFIFQNETYRDGFIEKDFKISALSLEDVHPTLDEITQFKSKDGSDSNGMVNLSVIAEASRKAAIAVLQPGDHVEVFEGEQAGVHGVVEEINGDIVTITAVGSDIEGQKVDLEARSVRKRFKPGDHVKVMQGQNADETGLVVSVTDNVVTFVSDMSMQEVSVFSKDLREAAEVGSSTNTIGNYELHDLVQLDAQTVGVIFKTERDSFRVLDQNGQVRLVQPHQISMRRDSTRAIACDSEGHELRTNDNVKEVDGEGRKGRVLHTHQSFFAFLHNRDITENGGVFVTRARSLASQAPKGGNAFKAGADLSKMNPAIAQPGGMVGSGAMGRGPRDRHIGLTVTVVKGPHKGYVGRIKDTNGNIARVELLTGNKVISIDKEKLRKMLPDGKLGELDMRVPWGGPPNGGGGGYNMGPPSGGQTPFGAGSSKTPNPYAMGEGRTPAWTSSRTPNPYNTDSGKTPAWNALSRTPNPYAGDSRTPAWSANSRTPNPYASGANTGGWGGGGGATYGGATPGRNPTYGGATPGRSAWGSTDADAWGGSWGGSAATPAAAPTPFAVSQTPADSVATPAPARTPAAVWTGGNDYSSVATPAATSQWGGSNNTSQQLSEGVSNIALSLSDDWLFDNAIEPFHSRLKIELRGTKTGSGWHGGDLEGKSGRIVAGTKAPAGYQQTAMVSFENSTEPDKSVPALYIVPVHPTMVHEEVLVGAGKHKGEVMVVREQDDDTCTVSTKQDPGNVKSMPSDILLSLYPEQ
ncbi:hypothetical protein D9611_008618 [Ephemerocybe angulata]|uniref:Transcription elongation factor SPT5 n=1 Tax=Ephemerocybe angulata TaxID=980116 RepID=A0A8H5AYR2_9AGAR|nr:hypothetical protein D9611_008618 [Tulosesus angulatus]